MHLHPSEQQGRQPHQHDHKVLPVIVFDYAVVGTSPGRDNHVLTFMAGVNMSTLALLVKDKGLYLIASMAVMNLHLQNVVIQSVGDAHGNSTVRNHPPVAIRTRQPPTEEENEW